MFLVVASLHFGANSSHIQHILAVMALAAPRGRHGFGVSLPVAHFGAIYLTNGQNFRGGSKYKGEPCLPLSISTTS